MRAPPREHPYGRRPCPIRFAHPTTEQRCRLPCPTPARHPRRKGRVEPKPRGRPERRTRRSGPIIRRGRSFRPNRENRPACRSVHRHPIFPQQWNRREVAAVRPSQPSHRTKDRLPTGRRFARRWPAGISRRSYPLPNRLASGQVVAEQSEVCGAGREQQHNPCRNCDPPTAVRRSVQRNGRFAQGIEQALQRRVGRETLLPQLTHPLDGQHLAGKRMRQPAGIDVGGLRTVAPSGLGNGVDKGYTPLLRCVNHLAHPPLHLTARKQACASEPGVERSDRGQENAPAGDQQIQQQVIYLFDHASVWVCRHNAPDGKRRCRPPASRAQASYGACPARSCRFRAG